MALVLDKLGKYDEALRVNTEIYEKEDKITGELANKRALLAQNNIAMVLSHMGKFEESLKVYYEVLNKKKVIFGPNNFVTANTMSNIVDVLFNLKKYDESLNMAEKALSIQKCILGPNHPDTIITQYQLANILFQQNNYKKAYKAYKESYNLLKAIWGNTHPYVLDVEQQIQLLELGLQAEGFVENKNAEKYDIELCIAASKGDKIISMFKAAESGDVQRIKTFIHDGVGINDKDVHGRTMLHLAVNRGHIPTVKFLLQNEADIKLVTSKGNTPLHTAVLNGSIDIIKILLHHIRFGELTNCINAQTPVGGTTALHIAAQRGFTHIITLLLKYGAIYNISNKDGHTPSCLAKDKSSKKIFKSLEKFFENAEVGNKRMLTELQTLNDEQFSAMINARDKQNRTLLQASVINKNRDIAIELTKMIKAKNSNF